MVEVKPIRTEQDYEAALSEIRALMQAEAGTPAGDRLDRLVTHVQAYEQKHHAIEPPNTLTLTQ